MRETIKEKFQPIVKYLKPFKKAVAVAVILVVLENIITLLLPLLYGKVIDIVIAKKSFEKIVLILLLSWVILELLRSWLMRAKVKKVNKIAFLASQNLMTSSVKYLTKLPLAFHKNKKIGEIIQRFSRADSYLYAITDRGLFQIIPEFTTSFLAFIIIIWIRWELALIYVLFIAIYSWVTIKKTRPIIKQQKKLNKVFEKIYGNIFDRTLNVFDIKSNTAEETEHKRNLANFKKGFHHNRKQVAMWMDMSFYQDSIFTFSFLILFILGIYFVSSNIITIGQFVILLAYINLTASAVNKLGSYYKGLQEGLTTIERADKIFQEVPERYDTKGDIEVEGCKGKIEFKNINFSYGEGDILKNVSFKGEAGKIIAIVGKSGEGKSTLINLISRYISPQRGLVSLDGKNIQEVKLKSLRRQIAIVPQEVSLFNDTIRNNIGYSKLSASNKEIITASKLAYCHEFIEKFPKKYDQLVGERGVKLSTGQKQRVAIARAILRDPKILILDEATSALDSESEKYIQKALVQVMKNRTTFVIAHRLSTIKKADLIIVIENGKLVESGNHEELINKGGIYQKLSKLQRINV